MFSASLKRQQVVAGLDGGFVVLGVPTSSNDQTGNVRFAGSDRRVRSQARRRMENAA